MNPTAKLLVALGAGLIAIGLGWGLIGKYVGKLPGDIAIRRENFQFYFPLTTSILASILLSLIAYLVRWFGSR